MIRTELYEDALHRLRELEEMRVIYVPTGHPGEEKVAHLITFARAILPDLIKIVEEWFQAEEVSDELEQVRFQLAMDIMTQPIDQGVLHMMDAMRRVVE